MGDPSTQEKSLRNILIIGNQYLSRTIINGLLVSKSEYSITLLTYPNQAPYLPPSAKASYITHKTSNLSQDSLEREFQGQDVVISTVSPGDVSLQKRIIQACIASQVRGFIPNEFGLDSRDELVQERLPAYKARAEVIEYLKEWEERLAWVGISVGVILDHELLDGKLGFDLKWQSASIPGSSDARFAATSLQRVGQIVDVLIINWDVVEKSYIVIPGCVSSVDELSRCLQEETHADWVIDFTDTEDVVRSGSKMLEAGWPDAGWMLLQRTVIFGKNGGRVSESSLGANAKFGLDDENIKDIVHTAVHEWNHSTKGDCGCN